MRWVAFTTSAVLAIVLFNFRLAPIAAIYLALAAYNATQGLWPKAGEIAFQVLAGAVAAGGSTEGRPSAVPSPWRWASSRPSRAS